MTTLATIILPWCLGAIAHAAPTHDITLDDAFTLDGVDALAVNRSGTAVVYVRTRWDDASDHQRSDLWVLETRSGSSRRLTFSDASVSTPRIGPHDDTVYYLADDEDGHSQVYSVPTEGGVPRQITTVDTDIEAYRLTNRGEALWLLTHEIVHGDDAWEALRDTHPDLHYVDRTYTRSTIHRLDLNDWRMAAVWSPEAYITGFDVTEEGTQVAAVTAPDARLITHEGGTEVDVYFVATQTTARLDSALWRRDAASPYGWLLDPTWSSDGRALAHRVDFDGYPGETFVTEFAGGEPVSWKVPRPGEVTPVGGSLHWTPGTRELCERVADHGRVRVLCVPKNQRGESGRARAFPAGDVDVRSYALSGDGRDIYAVVGTPTEFPEIYRMPARGNLLPRRVTRLNPHTADWRLPHVQVVSWTAPDGTSVEGMLETPAGWTRDDGPLPMVVRVHGGPTGHDTVALRLDAGGRTTFASAGWALLTPNYRGSIGYGDAFLTDLIGHENDVDVADILSGVDAMVGQGIADADRLAVMGWSNGGYLAAALTTHTDRFRAASMGAGIVDQTLQWALEDTPAHVISFLGGKLPWEAPELAQAGSPIWSVAAVTTPTLIHSGDDDARVPHAHAQAWFRALDTYLHVPAELILYPGSGHGLTRRSEQRAKLAWDHAWFDHWVRDGAPQPGSPPTSAETAAAH